MLKRTVPNRTGGNAMLKRTSRSWNVVSAIPMIAAIAVMALGALPATAGGGASTGRLRATAVKPDASGKYEENVKIRLQDGSMIGDLTVTARNLTPRKTYKVNVAGLPIGKLRTNRKGSGIARFKAQVGTRTPKNVQQLTEDPRGKRIALSNHSGEEVLEGEIADPNTPGGVGCCLDIQDQNGHQQGCDSLLPATCTALGGKDMGTGSCEPDPCPNAGVDGGPEDGSGVPEQGSEGVQPGAAP
jgi:hypothetical protein